MTDPVEEDCPVCNSSESAKEQFAAAKVAEHIDEKATREDAHQQWVDEHTDDGTVAEIQDALDDGSPRR
ncbi:MAG: hypothetical protein ABEH81_00335 [Halopenitus sp.]